MWTLEEYGLTIEKHYFDMRRRIEESFLVTQGRYLAY